MVDLFTVIPIWVTFNKSAPRFSDIHDFNMAIVYILFGLSTTRILRALRIHKKLILMEDEVRRRLGEMVLTITVMILFSTFLTTVLFDSASNKGSVSIPIVSV